MGNKPGRLALFCCGSQGVDAQNDTSIDGNASGRDSASTDALSRRSSTSAPSSRPRTASLRSGDSRLSRLELPGLDQREFFISPHPEIDRANRIAWFQRDTVKSIDKVGLTTDEKKLIRQYASSPAVFREPMNDGRMSDPGFGPVIRKLSRHGYHMDGFLFRGAKEAEANRYKENTVVTKGQPLSASPFKSAAMGFLRGTQPYLLMIKAAPDRAADISRIAECADGQESKIEPEECETLIAPKTPLEVLLVAKGKEAIRVVMSQAGLPDPDRSRHVAPHAMLALPPVAQPGTPLPAAFDDPTPSQLAAAIDTITGVYALDLAHPVDHGTPHERLHAAEVARKSHLALWASRTQLLDTRREMVERRAMACRLRDGRRRDAVHHATGTAALDLAVSPSADTGAVDDGLLHNPLFRDVAYSVFDMTPDELHRQLTGANLCASMKAELSRLQVALDSEDTHLERLSTLMQQAIRDIQAAWEAPNRDPASPVLAARREERSEPASPAFYVQESDDELDQFRIAD
jgi:hypothetical protein